MSSFNKKNKRANKRKQKRKQQQEEKNRKQALLITQYESKVSDKPSRSSSYRFMEKKTNRELVVSVMQSMKDHLGPTGCTCDKCGAFTGSSSSSISKQQDTTYAAARVMTPQYLAKEERRAAELRRAERIKERDAAANPRKFLEEELD